MLIRRYKKNEGVIIREIIHKKCENDEITVIKHTGWVKNNVNIIGEPWTNYKLKRKEILTKRDNEIEALRVKRRKEMKTKWLNEKENIDILYDKYETEERELNNICNNELDTLWLEYIAQRDLQITEIRIANMCNTNDPTSFLMPIIDKVFIGKLKCI